MKTKFKVCFMILLLCFVLMINVTAQVYTSESSSHRIYYRDGTLGPGVYSTHYSLNSAGSAIFASVYGEVNGHSNFYYDYSGINSPRSADVSKYFSGNYHSHSHGDV